MNTDTLNNLQPLLKRLPSVANLVIVVAIGLVCARLFWLVWPSETVSFPTAVTGNNQDVKQAQVSLDSITSTQLFGAPPSDKAASSQTETVITAPETRLDLVLTGVIVNIANQSAQSRALIKNAEGEQNVYAVGDVITGNVKLHAIHPTRVILDRNGRYETLTLEQLSKKDSIERVASGQLPEEIGQTLDAVRDQVLRNPSKITEYIRLEPAKQNGKLVGYRAYPGPNEALFKKLGLNSGAIITKVNGVSLTNSQSAMKALNKLANAPQITVTLKGDNGQRTISVNLQ